MKMNLSEKCLCNINDANTEEEKKIRRHFGRSWKINIEKRRINSQI